MVALKNKPNLKYILFCLTLVSIFSCKEVRGTDNVLKRKKNIINPVKIDNILINISDFNIGGFKYCDFDKSILFNKIKPIFFYCKIDSITDEISYKNFKIDIKQPYRFENNKICREIILNNEKLVVKRILIRQDENNDWYTFTNLLIDYQSSDNYYLNENYFLMINQPEGLSGSGNSISFIQFIDLKTKKYYEFFLNNNLCNNK